MNEGCMITYVQLHTEFYVAKGAILTYILPPLA